ncbi:DNA mismatch repair protein MutS [Flavobacterium sp. CYK-4]|uniref:Smr/MutS family protein n=1 Tax=Flavobacterium lotistagni TaxID=2709660 RepID=UPI00140D79E4|nr:Smr/MutS family protein [Flavobacterium lotistagni]NHM07089.1 DNA mismatch repair protein MutS [Flavobacterium lotistagni]
MFKIGDQVSVLDDAIDGTVISIKNNEITIETDEGFTMTYFVNQLIKNFKTSSLSKNIESFNSEKIKLEKETAKRKNPVPELKVKGEIPPPEFDLHIEKLVKNFRSMSHHEILTLQSETAKRHIEFAIRNRIPKIIFIHGVGEGILKAELDFMLGRYENISFRDANYQKYGMGATEVYFKQNSKLS